MKILQYILVPFIIFSYSSFLKSEDIKILFGWKTSSGFLLKNFGDKNIHPQYKGEVKNSKPNSEIYLKCMIKAEVNPNETVIVEDSHIGRKGALSSGAYLCGVEDSDDVSYEKIKNNECLSLLKVTIKTGRTHQIRVHSAENKNPIFGDKKYGGGKNKAKGYIPEVSKKFTDAILNFDRHALHAKKITFIHPNTDDELSIDAPIPKDILKLQKQLKIINE